MQTDFMKYTKFFLLIFLCFQCQQALSQKKSYHIHLNIADSSLKKSVLGNTFVKGSIPDETTISIPIDSNFNFEVNEVDVSIFHLRIESEYRKIDTCGKYIFYFKGYPKIDLNNFVPYGKDTLISFDYPLKCNAAQNPCNNICPKCKKTDKIKPVRYGLPLEDPLTGDIDSEYYSPSCDFLPCSENWYCERDKLLF